MVREIKVLSYNEKWEDKINLAELFRHSPSEYTNAGTLAATWRSLGTLARLF